MILGLYGSGMHDFILTEAELGTRVAMAIDAADVEPMGWFYDWLYVMEFGVAA